jgi:hypothetical protein
MMRTTIELTEAEAQFLRELLLKQIDLLSDVSGGTEAEKYLKGIDKTHADNIYRKLM